MKHDEAPAAPQSVHAFADEIARLDAVATAAAVRAGDLHPREVVGSAIERALALEPELRAVAAPDFERAMATAAGGASGPFAGVPTFIKDMIDVAGLPTRQGTQALENAAPATKTEPLAAQMFEMGMVCLGKSTLPEFGFPPSTEFPHTEPTRNPWNLDHTPGGSSGGAAAMVAAGVVPIAHAADGGGSIRIPAACCGLVGLKPTRNRLLQPDGTRRMPVQVVCDGVLTRSVRDTALYFAEAEKRFRNPKLPPVGHVTEPLRRRLRIGAVIDSPNGGPVDAATRRVFAETIGLLEDLGHRVETMPAPVTAQMGDDFIHYYGMMAFTVSRAGRALFGPTFDRSKLTDLTEGWARQFARDILRTPGAIVRLRRSAQAYSRMFDGFDVFLSPTVGQVPPPVGHLCMKQPFAELLPKVVAWVGFTPLANAAGAPSISLPLGFDAEHHLPVGMMFGADVGRDALLLELALELEQARPWRRLGDAPGAAAA